jgi:hypothetical protein
MLSGLEAPHEYFVYMAHWGYFGTDTGFVGDQIYNGAFRQCDGYCWPIKIVCACPLQIRYSFWLSLILREDEIASLM